jgi:hypothetical protein
VILLRNLVVLVLKLLLVFGYCSDPIELIGYIASVAEFGFNHIIIIGEIHFGMVFLDLYGRVFL